MALVSSPIDYQQKETVRIMYIHVPAAWLGMGGYMALAACSFTHLVWRNMVSDIAAKAIAVPGAIFTFICLISGSIWGKPMWGTWWVWDARLTSMLILFLIYTGYIYIRGNAQNDDKARKAAAIYALVGLINLPIIRFSVEWWNTLHQPASVIRGGGNAIHPAMMYPLIGMFAAFSMVFAWMVIVRIQTILLKSHR